MDLSVPTLIRFYFATTIIPIGIVCNTLAIIIFKRRKLNQSNIFGFLHLWLCLFDILSLLNQMVFAFLEYFNINIIAHSNITCKTLYGWVKYADHLSSFQTIIIALYLFITICYPNKRERFHQHKFKLILLMIILVALIDSFYIVYDKRAQYESYANITNVTNQVFIAYNCKTDFLLDFILVSGFLPETYN
jgi:hypothetical protein